MTQPKLTVQESSAADGHSSQAFDVDLHEAMGDLLRAPVADRLHVPHEIAAEPKAEEPKAEEPPAAPPAAPQA